MKDITKESNINNIQEQINSYLKRKNIKSSFIQECITEFVQGHTKLYGHIVSAEELLGRLNENLDKVSFLGENSNNAIELGEYIGRINDDTDQNEIVIYSKEDDFELSEYDKKYFNLYTAQDKKRILQELVIKKKDIKSVILHELTHAAYTIKGTHGIGEKHIFSEAGKSLFGLDHYSIICGNNDYTETIVNYISNRIEGNNPEELKTYKYETQSIYKLADKIGEDSIIQSAWNADEKQFQKAYIEKTKTSLDSYNEFSNCMKRMVILRNTCENIKQYNIQSKENLNQMEQLLEGKNLGENNIKSNSFKEISSTTNIKISSTFPDETKGIKSKTDLIENQKKDGLQDVQKGNIRKSLLSKATNYIRNTVKSIQDKLKTSKEER